MFTTIVTHMTDSEGLPNPEAIQAAVASCHNAAQLNELHGALLSLRRRGMHLTSFEAGLFVEASGRFGQLDLALSFAGECLSDTQDPTMLWQTVGPLLVRMCPDEATLRLVTQSWSFDVLANLSIPRGIPLSLERDDARLLLLALQHGNGTAAASIVRRLREEAPEACERLLCEVVLKPTIGVLHAPSVDPSHPYVERAHLYGTGPSYAAATVAKPAVIEALIAAGEAMVCSIFASVVTRRAPATDSLVNFAGTVLAGCHASLLVASEPVDVVRLMQRHSDAMDTIFGTHVESPLSQPVAKDDSALSQRRFSQRYVDACTRMVVAPLLAGLSATALAGDKSQELLAMTEQCAVRVSALLHSSGAYLSTETEASLYATITGALHHCDLREAKLTSLIHGLELVFSHQRRASPDPSTDAVVALYLSCELTAFNGAAKRRVIADGSPDPAIAALKARVQTALATAASPALRPASGSSEALVPLYGDASIALLQSIVSDLRQSEQQPASATGSPSSSHQPPLDLSRNVAAFPPAFIDAPPPAFLFQGPETYDPLGPEAREHPLRFLAGLASRKFGMVTGPDDTASVSPSDAGAGHSVGAGLALGEAEITAIVRGRLRERGGFLTGHVQNFIRSSNRGSDGHSSSASSTFFDGSFYRFASDPLLRSALSVPGSPCVSALQSDGALDGLLALCVALLRSTRSSEVASTGAGAATPGAPGGNVDYSAAKLSSGSATGPSPPPQSGVDSIAAGPELSPVVDAIVASLQQRAQPQAQTSSANTSALAASGSDGNVSFARTVRSLFETAVQLDPSLGLTEPPRRRLLVALLAAEARLGSRDGLSLLSGTALRVLLCTDSHPIDFAALPTPAAVALVQAALAHNELKPRFNTAHAALLERARAALLSAVATGRLPPGPTDAVETEVTSFGLDFDTHQSMPLPHAGLRVGIPRDSRTYWAAQALALLTRNLSIGSPIAVVAPHPRRPMPVQLDVACTTSGSLCEMLRLPETGHPVRVVDGTREFALALAPLLLAQGQVPAAVGIALALLRRGLGVRVNEFEPLFFAACSSGLLVEALALFHYMLRQTDSETVAGLAAAGKPGAAAGSVSGDGSIAGGKTKAKPLLATRTHWYAVLLHCQARLLGDLHSLAIRVRQAVRGDLVAGALWQGIAATHSSLMAPNKRPLLAVARSPVGGDAGITGGAASQDQRNGPSSQHPGNPSDTDPAGAVSGLKLVTPAGGYGRLDGAAPTHVPFPSMLHVAGPEAGERAGGVPRPEFDFAPVEVAFSLLRRLVPAVHLDLDSRVAKTALRRTPKKPGLPVALPLLVLVEKRSSSAQSPVSAPAMTRIGLIQQPDFFAVGCPADIIRRADEDPEDVEVDAPPATSAGRRRSSLLAGLFQHSLAPLLGGLAHGSSSRNDPFENEDVTDSEGAPTVATHGLSGAEWDHDGPTCLDPHIFRVSATGRLVGAYLSSAVHQRPHAYPPPPVADSESAATDARSSISAAWRLRSAALHLASDITGDVQLLMQHHAAMAAAGDDVVAPGAFDPASPAESPGLPPPFLHSALIRVAQATGAPEMAVRAYVGAALAEEHQQTHQQTQRPQSRFGGDQQHNQESDGESAGSRTWRRRVAPRREAPQRRLTRQLADAAIQAVCAHVPYARSNVLNWLTYDATPEQLRAYARVRGVAPPPLLAAEPSSATRPEQVGGTVASPALQQLQGGFLDGLAPLPSPVPATSAVDHAQRVMTALEAFLTGVEGGGPADRSNPLHAQSPLKSLPGLKRRNDAGASGAAGVYRRRDSTKRMHASIPLTAANLRAAGLPTGGMRFSHALGSVLSRALRAIEPVSGPESDGPRGGESAALGAGWRGEGDDDVDQIPRDPRHWLGVALAMHDHAARACGLQLSHATYSALLAACARRNATVSMAGLYGHMRERGVLPLGLRDERGAAAAPHAAASAAGPLGDVDDDGEPGSDLDSEEFGDSGGGRGRGGGRYQPGATTRDNEHDSEGSKHRDYEGGDTLGRGTQPLQVTMGRRPFAQAATASST